ncbi:MAG: fumarylacetoacetate hydrolase family protein [Pseudomonadota bacterium]
MALVFAAPPLVTVPVTASDDLYPVHRIYCVGRNYAAHAREMGKDPDRDPPFFFCKPADAVVMDGNPVPYPSRTGNLHHEIELVVAIGREGKDIPEADAEDYIFGYAVGNDITRRDLQLQAREAGRPWDTGKAFDLSAAITAIYPVSEYGHIREGEITISVDGEVRQEADIRDLIWDVPEIIAELSTLFTLKPGDLIYTGTPAGVGAVEPGQTMVGRIAGLGELTNAVVAS